MELPRLEMVWPVQYFQKSLLSLEMGKRLSLVVLTDIGISFYRCSLKTLSDLLKIGRVIARQMMQPSSVGGSRPNLVPRNPPSNEPMPNAPRPMIRNVVRATTRVHSIPHTTPAPTELMGEDGTGKPK